MEDTQGGADIHRPSWVVVLSHLHTVLDPILEAPGLDNYTPEDQGLRIPLDQGLSVGEVGIHHLLEDRNLRGILLLVQRQYLNIVS